MVQDVSLERRGTRDADPGHAGNSAAASRVRLISLATKVACPQLGLCAGAVLGSRELRLPTHPDLVGIACEVFDIAMAVRPYLVPTANRPRVSRFEDATPAPFDRAPTRIIEDDERPRWADAAASLYERGVLDATDRASIDLIRVDSSEIELLVSRPAPVPPRFTVTGDRSVLRLDHSVQLEPVTDPADTDDAALVLVGTDDHASYFADPSAIGETFDLDRGSAHARIGTALTIVRDGGSIVVEPYGLRLRPSPELATVPESTVEPEPVPAQSDDECSTTAEARPGGVEVRILREIPDLVGPGAEGCSAAGVELVAYLALHGNRATSGRLRDVLGTSRSRGSQAPKTVWTAASAARKALGPDRFPAAGGNQLYALGADVSCDWKRFEALVGVAEHADDPIVRKTTLTEALELVGGVPALASNRFTWLDTEGILTNIARVVVAAAQTLAAIALEEGEADLCSWAIRRGRVLAPEDSLLDDVEQRLTEAVVVGRR